jgi:hypothetical protein
VRHHHEQPALDLAIRTPALLATLDAILDRHEERIQKYSTGLLETDAVFALVGEVLRLIPLEPDSCHANIVIIFLTLCNLARPSDDAEQLGMAHGRLGYF